METALRDKKVFEYEDLPFLPEGHYEIINGEQMVMTPTGFMHGEFEGAFYELLKKHFEKKGYVAVGEIGVVINKKPFRLRAADIVYISKNTVPEKPKEILEIAPDLIIEILSKDDTACKMNDKVKDYLSIGVKRIILVDPYTEVITIYQHSFKDARNFYFNEEFELFDGVKIKMKEIL